VDEVGTPPVARTGVGGLLALYAEALGLLRDSPRLRASLARWLTVGLVFTEAFAVGVAQLVSWRAALLAALGGALWWLFVGAVLVGGAPLLLTHPERRRVEMYGVPNGLTAIRAWSCLPLLLCAALPLPGDLGLVLWCSIGGPVGMLDYVDGIVARRVGPLTELGRALDPAGDALFFSMAAVGSELLGIIPGWLAVLLLVRYIGPLLATPVVLLTRRRPELTHTVWGRRNTGLVGVVLFTCMWVRIFHGPVDAVALALGIPLIATTTVLHFASLAQRTREAPLVA
jgi:phosphatidylglycerophosphate synthase